MAIDSLQLMQESATRVFELFAQARQFEDADKPKDAQAKRDAAGRELMKNFSRWMDRFFVRMGLDADQAQDFTQDTVLRLLAYSYEVRGNAFALICRARRSVFIDYLKHRKASKRKAGAGGALDGSAEIQLDEEEWITLSDTAAADSSPIDLIDCVKRKLHKFQALAAGRAEVLELHAHGLSAREIAAVVFDKPEDKVTSKDEGSVRDRIYNAKKQAQALFEECKD